MRFLVLLLVLQMVLAGCSPNGGFHASQSVVPTDLSITPKNPMIIQPRGEKATPHVLGFLEISEAVLEKDAQKSELNFQALVSLKTGQNSTRWSTKVTLRGSLGIDGSAVLYPVNGDVSGELPVRARVTCMSELNPTDCDQAIIDVFVKEGDKTHAAQVLAEMRQNVPPESFAPKKEESEEEALPPTSSGPTRRYDNGRAARAKRVAEEKRRQEELLRQRMNPELPETDEATVELLKKKYAEQKAAQEKREADLRARMTPPEAKPLTPQQKALEEALKRKYADPRTTPKTGRLPRATPKSDDTVKTTPKTSRLPRVTPKVDETPKTTPKTGRLPKVEPKKDVTPVTPKVPEKALEKTPEKTPEKAPEKTPEKVPAKTPEKVVTEKPVTEAPEKIPVPEAKPKQENSPATPETEEEEAEEEEEGIDPSDRPSLFIGTLHEPSDDLFKTDRPGEEDKNIPVPTPRPDPKDGKKEEPVVVTPTPPKTTGSRPRDQVIGLANKGSLQNASNMTKKSESVGFKVMRPGRNRHYGSFELVEIVENLAKFAKSRGSIGTLQIGDLSQLNGGRMTNSQHKSHQNGLDADIGYPVSGGIAPFTKMVAQGKVSSGLKINETWALMKAAWATKAVDRIFMDAKIKTALCQVAKKTGELDANGKGSAVELLRRIRPTPGHATHFHLRIRCSTEQPRCRMIGDPPFGSGC